MTFDQWLDLLSKGGALVAVSALATGLLTGRIVPRWALDREHEDRLKAEERNDKANEIARAALAALERHGHQ